METNILKTSFKIKAEIKGLIVNLTKYTRSYDENFEVLMKELREEKNGGVKSISQENEDIGLKEGLIVQASSHLMLIEKRIYL